MANKLFLTNGDKVFAEYIKTHNIEEMVEKATQEGFWRIMCELVPECVTGDLEPLMVLKQDTVNTEAFRQWLYNNLPCMTINGVYDVNTDMIIQIEIIDGKKEVYDIGEIVLYDVDREGSTLGVITESGIMSIGESAKDWLSQGVDVMFTWQNMIEGECNCISKRLKTIDRKCLEEVK